MFNDTTVREIKEAFSYFDRDEDGIISVDELGEVMKAFGHDCDELDLQLMIETVDKDGDGAICFDEFLDWMTSTPSHKSLEDELLMAFETLDSDHDGLLSPIELKKVFSKVGEKLTEDEVKNMISECDLDGDGKLSFTEFTRIMANNQ